MTTKSKDTALPSRRAMVGALAALPAAGVPMRARHGFERESNAQRTGEQRLERPQRRRPGTYDQGMLRRQRRQSYEPGYSVLQQPPRRNIYAIKGMAGPRPIWPKRASLTRTRDPVFVIGVDTAKDAIHASQVSEGCYIPSHGDPTRCQPRIWC